MNSGPILVRIIAATAIALAGGALSGWLARTHKQLCAFISLGAGTLLGVAAFGIVPECLESLHWWELLLGAVSGYFLFALVTRHIYYVCPACATGHFDAARTHRLGEFATAMMIALGIHCTVDGLALAAGLDEATPVDLSITFAICVHKFPEGLALGALLLGGGVPRARTMWLVAAVESTTVFGGLLGWFVLRDVSEFWLALALANAAGGFFYMALHAVLGEIFKDHKAIVLGYFSAGFSVVSALIFFFHLRA